MSQVDGRTIKTIHEEGWSYKRSYEDYWAKGTPESPVTVTVDDCADIAIELTNGTVLVISSCGCCGGAQLDEVTP